VSPDTWPILGLLKSSSCLDYNYFLPMAHHVGRSRLVSGGGSNFASHRAWIENLAHFGIGRQLRAHVAMLGHQSGDAVDAPAFAAGR
jgi:hypothetical protein